MVHDVVYFVYSSWFSLLAVLCLLDGWMVLDVLYSTGCLLLDVARTLSIPLGRVYLMWSTFLVYVYGVCVWYMMWFIVIDVFYLMYST